MSRVKLFGSEIGQQSSVSRHINGLIGVDSVAVSCDEEDKGDQLVSLGKNVISFFRLHVMMRHRTKPGPPPSHVDL